MAKLITIALILISQTSLFFSTKTHTNKQDYSSLEITLRKQGIDPAIVQAAVNRIPVPVSANNFRSSRLSVQNNQAENTDEDNNNNQDNTGLEYGVTTTSNNLRNNFRSSNSADDNNQDDNSNNTADDSETTTGYVRNTSKRGVNSLSSGAVNYGSNGVSSANQSSVVASQGGNNAEGTTTESRLNLNVRGNNGNTYITNGYTRSSISGNGRASASSSSGIN